MVTPSKIIGQTNLDLTGARLVTRGALVSWHGLRFTVSKVRMGTCYPLRPSDSLPSFVACQSVQVVASCRV